MIEKLYTVEEVAELASVTGRTIRNYLKSGQLKGRKIGGQWRFPESEVQRLLTGAADGVDEILENDDFFEDETDLPTDDSDFFEENVFNGEPEDTPKNIHPIEKAPTPQEEQLEEQLYEQARPTREAPAGYTEPAVLPVPEQPAMPLQQQQTSGQPQPAAQPQQAPVFSPPPISNTGTFTPPPMYAQQMQQQPMQNQGYPQPSQAFPTLYNVNHQQAGGPAPYMLPYGQPSPYAAPQQPMNPYATGQFSAIPPVDHTPFGGQPDAQQAYSNGPYFGGYAHPGAYTPPSAPQPETKPATASSVSEPAPSTPSVPPKPEEPPVPPVPATPDIPEDTTPDVPELSDVGLRVAQFASEVHDCSDGPQTCTVIDMYQSFEMAKETSERIAEIAMQESETGSILCQSFVEYDARYYIARYTLFGSSLFLSRCLTLIG